MNALDKRFERSIKFLRTHVNENSKILDLGVENRFSQLIRMEGYEVNNTQGQDLDLKPDSIMEYENPDVVTAFEILEHLVSPFPLLRIIPSNKLIATVPLRLWFSKSYRNTNDPRDQHYHEFEDWQFDWLLEKAGWRIVDRQKWKSYSGQIGIRPLLRRFYPRYYAVYAERS